MCLARIAYLHSIESGDKHAVSHKTFKVPQAVYGVCNYCTAYDDS